LKPAAGAGPVSVTVPVEDAPPPKLEGLRLTPESAAASIVSVALTDEPPAFAVTTAFCVAVTGDVLHVKDAELEPPGIRTDAGPPHAFEPELNVTLIPPAGAADPSFTVPVEAAPPGTSVGLKERDVNFGAVMVSVALAVLRPSVAKIEAVFMEETGVVVMTKVADLAPLGIVIEAGVVAAALEELRETVAPAPPALADKETVPFEIVPPATLTGESEIRATV